MTPSERAKYAEKLFQQYPDMFPWQRRQSILEGVVTLGMTPFEAKLAGGAFSFKVAADKSRWPDGSDPLEVMWAQSVKADLSEIWMEFVNASQFSNKQATAFRVYFDQGRAIRIENPIVAE